MTRRALGVFLVVGAGVGALAWLLPGAVAPELALDALGPIAVVVAALVMWCLVRVAAEADRAHQAVRESEERFRALVQHATDVILVIGEDARLLYVSPAASRITAFGPEHYIGTLATDHVHPDDAGVVFDTLALTLEHPGEAFTAQVRVRHRDGGWRWTETTATNRLDDASIGGIVGNLRDVTERKRVEALQAGEARVLAMIARGEPLRGTLCHLVHTVEEQLDGVHCSVRLLDGKGGALPEPIAPSLPVAYTRAVDELLARRRNPQELVERHVALPVGRADVATDPAWARLRELASVHGMHVRAMIPIVASESRQLLGVFAVYGAIDRALDVTEAALVERATALAAVASDRAAAEDRLEHQALHDPLTGLPNRALVLDRLDQALRRLERHGEAVALVFLDLDRFKVINDSLGHDTGDELLIAIGPRLASALRPDDTVARFGGDEFVVLCERIADHDEIMALGHRVLRALGEPFPLERGEAVVTASVGVAVTRDSGDRPERLLRDADVAMYRAKDAGGSRCELFDKTMHTRAVMRLLTERALRRAVEGEELRVFFQPQIELATGACVAVEALVRWEHPVRGLVEPAEFIPVAEETGLIVPIGTWVLERACAQARRWDRAGPGGRPLGVSVNLSARQLVRADLPQRIRRLVHEQGMEPSVLCLEVTESVLLDDVDTTADALRGLKDLGIRLAIDDFGTGYSSLTYLKRFPFDQLKIDQSFVRGLNHGSGDDAIVAATIDMAHALGMVAAAEGVETGEQLLRLAELGCDLAQGYHVAIPVPVDDLEDLAAAAGERA